MLFLYTDSKQCAWMCFSDVVHSHPRMNSVTHSPVPFGHLLPGRWACDQHSHTHSETSHSWGLVLCPPILKFLRTLPVGFCLVSKVIWDSAVCIPDWSLGHPRSSSSGWVLGPAPSYLPSVSWCSGPLPSSFCSCHMTAGALCLGGHQGIGL